MPCSFCYTLGLQKYGHARVWRKCNSAYWNYCQCYACHPGNWPNHYNRIIPTGYKSWNVFCSALNTSFKAHWTHWAQIISSVRSRMQANFLQAWHNTASWSLIPVHYGDLLGIFSSQFCLFLSVPCGWTHIQSFEILGGNLLSKFRDSISRYPTKESATHSSLIPSQ